MRAEECWIIRAEWSNSSDTYYGPFLFLQNALQWGVDRLMGDPACTQWSPALLSPASNR